ncbi:MAG TPA: DUF5985 family protein [Candidatus Sulfotelmatobacter sp.]|nr:DUF5985 family protein [Candidatus Sulfotelmatobacter sp.]
MIETFALGMISALSLTAGVFFLRFWRDTRDFFFIPFAVFFLIEAIHRFALLFFEHPNEGNVWLYLARLAALLLILFGILHKNYGRGGNR